MKPAFTGRFELHDVHRWDMIEAHGNFIAMNYRGTIDFPGQRFDLAAGPVDNANLPVSVQVGVSRLLTQPEWRVAASTSGIPASSLLQIARHMGTPLPVELAIDGQAAGTVAYAQTTGMQGELRIENANVALGQGDPFQVPQASLLIEGDEVRLQPAVLEAEGNSVQVEGSYAPFRQVLSAKLTGRNIRLARFGGLRTAPFAQHFKGGVWSGTLTYAGDAWSGNLHVSDTTAVVPGLAEPIGLSDGPMHASISVAIRLPCVRCICCAETWKHSASIAISPGWTGLTSSTYRYRRPISPTWNVCSVRHSRVGTIFSPGRCGGGRQCRSGFATAERTGPFASVRSMRETHG
jgi:hypothetical protein